MLRSALPVSFWNQLQSIVLGLLLDDLSVHLRSVKPICVLSLTLNMKYGEIAMALQAHD